MGVWQAIDAVGWGLMDKAYYVFDSAFWPDDSYFIIRVSPAVGEWVLWVNLHKVRVSNIQDNTNIFLHHFSLGCGEVRVID